MAATRVVVEWGATGAGLYSIEVNADGIQKRRHEHLSKDQVLRMVETIKGEFPDNIIEVTPAML